VSQTEVEREVVAVLGVLARGTNGPFGGPWKHLAVPTRLPVCIQPALGVSCRSGWRSITEIPA
jgi:hypothetical protein